MRSDAGAVRWGLGGRTVRAFLGLLLAPALAWSQEPGGAPGDPRITTAPGEKIVEGAPPGGLPYRLHLSDQASPQKPHGLVLWLHPSGGSANDVVERMAPLIRKHGLGLVVVTEKKWGGWTGEEIGQLMNVTLPALGRIPGVDVRRPVLWGYSAGGQIALELYWSGPEKLGGLILDAAYPLDMTLFSQGKAAPHGLPKDPSVQKVPFFVLVGDQDGGSMIWRKVEPEWRQARVPLDLRYLPGRRHEWLFGPAETEALDGWLKALEPGRAALPTAKKKA